MDHPDGSVSLPADVAYDVHRILLHYEKMPTLCEDALTAQRRVDEGHWLADCAERRSLDPQPWAWWERALVVSGSVIGGLLVGMVVGYVANDRITVVR